MDNEVDESNVLLLQDVIDDEVAIPVVTDEILEGQSQQALGHDEDEKIEKEIEREAQVWAYQGVQGGAGVTSLVVQTAYELSKGFVKSGREAANVLLIDLDFERGSCAAYLDVQPSMRIDELNAAAGRMDTSLAKTFIRGHGKNLSVVIAEGELGGNDMIDPAALLSLLDTVSTMFDYIVMDVPLMWRSWTQAVIGAADKFTLVTELSVPSMHKTKDLSQSISNAMRLHQPPQLLINKYERRALRNSVTLKDAAQVLDREDFVTVCVDDDIMRQAINSGLPVGKFRPEARCVKSAREYIDRWVREVVRVPVEEMEVEPDEMSPQALSA